MKVLVLAGGGGTRLWPLSRKNYPKQFLKLFQKESLFQKTIRRVLNLCSPEDVVVLTNKAHVVHVNGDIQEMDLKGIHVILEPEIRNTAPAIALGMKYISEVLKSPKDTPVLVLPSDHIIEPDHIFKRMIQKAEEIAKRNYLVTFGIKPTRPETGYGYIKLGLPLQGNDNVYAVEKFVEKPDIETAQLYVKDGGYLWNSGMFCFTIEAMLYEFQNSFQEILKLYGLNYKAFVERFSSLPNISIDYAVMEKAKKVAVVVDQIFWSDVGSWDAIYEIGKKDQELNVVESSSEVFLLDSKRNLVLGKDNLIALIGIEDTIVVDSPDALLIGKRGESQKVKEIVGLLEKHRRVEADLHKEEKRPWGSFRELFSGSGFKVKHIVVKPNQKLSLQKHRHRSEHWVVVKGEGLFTVGDKVVKLREDQDIYIPREELHRIECTGEVPLEIIEVQLGDYLGEDDIIRIEDVYGRT